MTLTTVSDPQIVKIKNKILTMLLISILLLAPAALSWAGAQKVGCFSMDGRRSYKCGQSWTDSYKGVVYDCTCNCPSTGTDCKPRARSGSTAPYSGGNINTDVGAKQFILGNLLGAILGNALNRQIQDFHYRFIVYKRVLCF